LNFERQLQNGPQEGAESAKAAKGAVFLALAALFRG
jgi:hypothetical protein